MSTEQITQTSQTVVQDDNKLVTREDLTPAPVPAKSLWSDSDRLTKLQDKMQQIAQVRIPVEQLPEEVILSAMAEVLAQLGWNNYASFKNTVQKILHNPNSVPFALRTRNKRTGRMDFWLVKVFVNVGEDQYYVDDNAKKFKKLDVLMSHQFCKYLRDFCRDEEKGFKDEVQFWMFTGSFKGNQHLDMSRFSANELQQIGETNPDNLCMVQMKFKSKEVYVGGGGKVRKQVGADAT